MSARTREPRHGLRHTTIGSFARSAVETARLLSSRHLRMPRTWLRRRLLFADGTTSVVFRETAVTGAPLTDTAVLVVGFRLRLFGTNRLAHALFRRECVLHTPLFAGFAGFRTKLWLSDPRTGTYRGVYEWDGAERATAYAETLCRLLRVVSEPGSVMYHVTPGLRRADLPAGLRAASGGREWWRVVALPSEQTAVWSA